MIDVRVYEILALIPTLNNGQQAIEPSADSDLGFKMFGYKDGDGTANKCLCKDQKARVTEVVIGDAVNGYFKFVPVSGILKLYSSADASSWTDTGSQWE